MKLLNKALLVGVLTATIYNANALIINENVFQSYGGDLNNIAASLKYANNELRESSYNNPFFTVGKIYGCTATWLGDDSQWTYILTAAHCYSYTSEITAVISPYDFWSWNNQLLASGKGFFYVPPERINKPAGFGGASTDIGILKIPKVAMPTDKNGVIVQRPILNDSSNEINNVVEFVGYGTWGVGLDQSGSYSPATGPRRLWATSKISEIFEKDHGIGAKYEPNGSTEYWARVASGDSGSAWWQDQNGKKIIIATTNGGHSYLSTGARVSKYIGWIQSIYPDVRVLSKGN
jgi:hypothetical protein